MSEPCPALKENETQWAGNLKKWQAMGFPFITHPNKNNILRTRREKKSMSNGVCPLTRENSARPLEVKPDT